MYLEPLIDPVGLCLLLMKNSLFARMVHHATPESVAAHPLE